MNYERPLGPKDEKSELDYDVSFVGVNERLPAMELPPGYVASARNCRFRNGRAETRPGAMICPWLRGADGRTPFAEVYGGMVYGDPNGDFWFLVAADGGVWKTQPSRTATPVPMPAGLVLTAATFAKFTQNFNEVVMQRGPDFPQLSMVTLDEGFKFIMESDAARQADLSPIPNASFGMNYLNRQWLIQGKDTASVSDVLDYTGYIPVTESFKINQGEADALVAMAPFGPAQVVMLKSERVYLMGNAAGDLSAPSLTLLTDEYGCGAPFSVAVRGNQMFWVDGEAKVASIQLTQLNQTQATSQRLSDDIPVTVNRINRLHVSGCVAEIWDGKLYVAAPLDDAEFVQTNILIGLAYGTGAVAIGGLIVGKKYRLGGSTDPNFISLTNGSDVYTMDGDFVATTATATITGVPASGGLTATLLPVLAGVNTGLLVYDFQVGAWCGTDENAPVFCVKALLRFPFNGELRLFMLGADGVLRLYEEGLEDDVLLQVPNPYLDILVTALPQPGDTIQVGINGTVITVTADAANTDLTWGCATLADAQANLGLGYDPSGAFQWSADGDPVVAIDQGLRVPAAVIEAVEITGAWAFVDAHLGVEVTSVEIETDIVTRGYVTRSYLFANEDKKRFLMLAALINSWSPDYNLSAITNGAFQETKYVEDQSADNTSYQIFDQPTWSPDNANDDWDTPKREDYSITLPPLGFNLGRGVIPEQEQTATDRVPVSEFGHWAQLHLNNTVGRVELIATFMEAQEGEKPSGRNI